MNYAVLSLRFGWAGLAFVIADQKFRLAFDDPSSPHILKRLESAARAKGTKVMVLVVGLDRLQVVVNEQTQFC